MNRFEQPPISELTDIHQIPITRCVLPNGIPLTIINAEEQEVVRLDLFFGGGFWTQEQVLQANTTLQMLKEGTREFSSEKIAETLDYYGSTLDLSTMAQHSCLTAYSLNKYYGQTLHLIRSLICEPIFPEKELKVLLNTEKRTHMINSTRVRNITMRKLRKALYGPNHPIGKEVVTEDFDHITPDILKSYYNKHFYTSNCQIFLSGKVEDGIIQQTKDLLGTDSFGITQNKIICKDYPCETCTEKRIFIEKEDAKQSSVKMGMLSIPPSHPDFHKMDILLTILGGYFGSRLMSNIREDKGYTYGIYSGIYAQPVTSPIYIMSEVNNENVEPLISEVYKEIDRLQNEKVGDEELSIVRNYMTGTLCRSMEISFNVADYYEKLYLNGLDDDFAEEKLNAIRSVTPEELCLLAQHYLCKENLKEVISGKKSS
jgi:zinc protease